MMNGKEMESLSKFISLILRHRPETVGITLDEHGWADAWELMDGLRKSGRSIDMDILEEIVRTDEKGRYSFSADKALIRANQGHSIPVDVELEEKQPPQYLYHGTAERFLDPILAEGLKPMSRLYVHLSKDEETALKVGRRHGKPVVLKIRAEDMRKDGHRFYLSANGVWLVKGVPAGYISVSVKCQWDNI